MHVCSDYSDTTTLPVSSVLSATVGEVNYSITLLEPVKLSFTFFSVSCIVTVFVSHVYILLYTVIYRSTLILPT